ncbi:Capn10, partial [Symbiodinium microadriaticum]
WWRRIVRATSGWCGGDHWSLRPTMSTHCSWITSSRRISNRVDWVTVGSFAPSPPWQSIRSLSSAFSLLRRRMARKA